MSAAKTAPVKAGAVSVSSAARTWLKALVFTGALATGLSLLLAGGTAVFACCAYHPAAALCGDRATAQRLFYTGWRIDGLCQAPDRSHDSVGAR